MRRFWWAVLLAISLVGCGGGGGGGGNNAAPATVTGTVLLAETNAPVTDATVSIGGQATQVDQNGNFTLSNAPSNATTATITSASAKTRTLAIALTANQTTALGSIFLSTTGYTATTTGTVVTQDTNQPVGNATVNIAGAITHTATNGTFTLTNLPVDLGSIAGAAIGVVTASGFEDKPIQAPFVFQAGNNPLGNIVIASPVGSTTPPPPFTISGTVTVNKTPTAGITVSLSSGATKLGSTTTDNTGTYYFWVVPGTYTVSATHTGSAAKQVTVTLHSLNTPVTAPAIAF